MKSLLLFFGTVVFWAAWPFWKVYFWFRPNRSRVVVRCDGQILLIRGWLGVGKWGLPGGGSHPGESMVLSAQRELREEVGISASIDALQALGNSQHRSGGITYKCFYFLLDLESQPAIKKRPYEIAEAQWFDQIITKTIPTDQDTRYALNLVA